MSRLETLLQFHREDPADAFTRFAIAQEYLKQGNIGEALSYYEQLAADTPTYVGTYYHLGKLYEQTGRKEDAIDIYRCGVSIAQEQKDFHARAELQDALLKAQGVDLEDEFD